jgi:hypothetical protein
MEIQRSFGLCTNFYETYVSLGVSLCEVLNKKSEIMRKQEENRENQMYREEGRRKIGLS